MLDRYLSEQLRPIFADQHRFELWRDVELAVLAAYAEIGQVSTAVLEQARAVPCPPAESILARERQTGHDVVAFLLEWTSSMPAQVSSAIHRGLTSSDVVDTALALLLREAGTVLLERIDDLVDVLAGHALAHRDTVRIGRTHGQHASPDVWGHRVADFAFAADRARTRLKRALDSCLVAKVSGPTGAYQHVTPAVEHRAADILGLRPVDVATQVVMRDGLAEWMFALAAAAAVCEAVALEVRLGQRSEMGELAEGAGAVRSGSSSMPHKANPVTSEKISGLARLVRAYVNPVLEGVALWHEGDLTHSSVERVAVPDSIALTEHIVSQTTAVMRELVVDARQMRRRAESEPVAALSNAALVHLTDAGLAWADAWLAVRSAARQAQLGTAASFTNALVDVVVAAWPQIDAASIRNLTEDVSAPDLDAVFDRLALLHRGQRANAAP